MKKYRLYTCLSRAHFCIAFFEILTMLTVVLTGMFMLRKEGISYIVTVTVIHGKLATELRGQSGGVQTSTQLSCPKVTAGSDPRGPGKGRPLPGARRVLLGLCLDGSRHRWRVVGKLLARLHKCGALGGASRPHMKGPASAGLSRVPGDPT